MGTAKSKSTTTGGTADKLALPFASTDAHFEAWDTDFDPALDNLSILTSDTDVAMIFGQLEPDGNKKGRIEHIVFTDGTMTIGSETAVQTLNAASKLDASEKEKRSKAAKKVIEEEKKKDKEQKAQDRDTNQRAPSSSNEAKKR